MKEIIIRDTEKPEAIYFTILDSTDLNTVDLIIKQCLLNNDISCKVEYLIGNKLHDK